MQERVLEIQTRLIGDHHPDTLDGMHNLGVLLLNTGDTESGLQLLRKALDGRRQVLGEDHPDTIQTAELLAEYEAQSQAHPQAG